MTPEERKEYYRVYRIKNKEKMIEYERLYRIKNKGNNKEYHKEYRQTEKCKKSMRIGQWKNKGIICEDFDKLYDTYINTNNCEWCHKDVSKKRDLEHNHYSGEVRGIVCRKCNQKMRYKDKRYKEVMISIKSIKT